MMTDEPIDFKLVKSGSKRGRKSGAATEEDATGLVVDGMELGAGSSKTPKSGRKGGKATKQKPTKKKNLLSFYRIWNTGMT